MATKRGTAPSAEAKPDGARAGNKPKGSLTVIGTGIKTAGQLTTESIAWMERADELLYVVGDPVGEAVIRRLKPTATSLATYYQEGQSRMFAYNAMVEHILGAVRSGKITVAAFYGHPGIFAYPSHESIRRAKREGFEAKMLPGISSEDCLFADLGVDPAVGGCQSYEATDFLLNAVNIEVSSQLVLWQIGTLCDWTYKRHMYNTSAMPLLVHKLSRFYPSTHEITVYEAPIFPVAQPMISRIPLYSLADFPITAAMTLYVPAARGRVPDAEMLELFKLGGPYEAQAETDGAPAQ